MCWFDVSYTDCKHVSTMFDRKRCTKYRGTIGCGPQNAKEETRQGCCQECERRSPASAIDLKPLQHRQHHVKSVPRTPAAPVRSHGYESRHAASPPTQSPYPFRRGLSPSHRSSVHRPLRPKTASSWTDGHRNQAAPESDLSLPPMKIHHERDIYERLPPITQAAPVKSHLPLPPMAETLPQYHGGQHFSGVRTKPYGRHPTTYAESDVTRWSDKPPSINEAMRPGTSHDFFLKRY